MKAAFAAFAITLTVLMVVTTIVGVQVRGDHWFAQHFALGLMTTLFTCLCHCVVLAYFMATGKMMRLAVEDARLDAALDVRARSLKLKAYATLMPGILLALLAAFSGGWATVDPARAKTHLMVVILSIATQLAAFLREYVLIAGNGRLLDDVFARHEAQKRSDLARGASGG
jgi:hypothetical protein